MSLKNKRIFISGGAGVIGREMVSLLCKEKSIILVGDLKPIPKDLPSEVIFRQGDLNLITQEEIDAFNPEVFIHLAATFERSEETYNHWEENFHHNLSLSHHLMTLMRNAPNLKRVVNASSYLIYDKSLYHFKDSQLKPYSLNENDKINPRNLTGLAKLAHEIELDFLSKFKSEKFSSVSARIFRGYGKNSRDIISRWIRSLLQEEEIEIYNEESSFDYIYAEDTAKSLIELAKIEYSGIVNVGTGRSRQVKEIIKILSEHFPKIKSAVLNSHNLLEASQADISLLQELISWKPERDIENTIPDIIKYEVNKNLQIKEVHHNVLITSISKKIPLIEAVKLAVSKIDEEILVIGSDIDKECLGKHFVDEFLLVKTLEETRIHEFIDDCLEKKISLIIPTRDGELDYFSKNKLLFQEKGIHVMISDQASINTCLDKIKFSNVDKLKKYLIPSFKSISNSEKGSFVVKEQFGAGAESIGVNMSSEVALKHSLDLENPIFQPFVEGYEVSVDAYIDLKGNVKGLVMRRRDLVLEGESQITSTFYNHALERKFYKIIESLNLYGHIILQAIIDSDEQINLIECNPRFGGASTLSIKAGLDSFYWLYLESIGKDITDNSFLRSNKNIIQIRRPYDIYL